MRMFLIVLICKIIYYASRFVGKQGVTLAGLIALKMDHQILQKLSIQVKKKIIVDRRGGSCIARLSDSR